ncbi:unnamed protein product [Symbiodinium sp. CCMP2592]|nr:unnamed protein product [Symbiodinium sp. CCMP2592]
MAYIDQLVWRLKELKCPAVFILCVVLVYYTKLGMLNQEIQYCEFFAGKANVFRSVSNSGYPSCAVDISYFDGISGTQSNPFDILSASGLALGIWLILAAKEDEFITIWGIVCSSWVRTNAYISKRSVLLPQGDVTQPRILSANSMASRFQCCTKYGRCLKNA